MDTAQWHQPSSSVDQRKVMRPPHNDQKEQQAIINSSCPRCNSTNTKFCYYNNYSLSQPRFICKTCRRYWTKGGSLRNIPVGGSTSRKIINNKKSSSNKNLVPPNLMIPKQKNPKNQDPNLGIFSRTQHHDFKTINELIQVPNPSCSSSFSSRKGGLMNSFFPIPNIANSTPHHDPNTTVNYSSGFSNLPCHLNFSLDHGIGSSNYWSFQGLQEITGTTGNKLVFPFHHQVSNTTNGADQSRDHQNGDSTSNYWNGGLW